MIRFAALNYSSDEEDSQEAQERAATKEAEESEAFTLYNRALSLQRQGSNDKAEEAFTELLNHPFITEALELLGDNVEGSTHPALQLLYSIYKNIANMALHRKDYKSAITSYIEAVKIDTTEVTVWYKIGTIAKQIYNFPLARMGFEVGLQCNPHHWPCLDNVITLLYAMNDYWYCLHYISKALEKDYGYTKGLVLRHQIYKEEPSLRESTADMFKNCDPSIDFIEIDAEERDEFINESLALAEERRKLSKPKQPELIKLPSPIQNFTWCGFGEGLIALYKMLKSSDPPLSMGRRVDLSAYSGEQQPEASSTEDVMDVDSAVPTSNEDKMDVDEMEEELDAKTVTSLEQILSNLPEDQMTELLQSTPNTPVKVSTAIQNPVTSCPSPMETDRVSPSEGIPKIILPTDDICSQNGMAETLGEPLDTINEEKLENENFPVTNSKTPENLSRKLFSPEGISKSKSQKRKKSSLLEDLGAKRRSARVRNTSKRKEEDCVNFQGLLLTFLPPTLRDYDEDMLKDAPLQLDTQISSTSDTKNTETEIKADKLCDTEEADIRQLLKDLQKNNGCLSMMMKFVFILSEKSHYKWPVGLSALFQRIYKMIRTHFDLPDTCSDDEEEDNLLTLGKTLLLNSELQLDHWTVTKSKIFSSPRQHHSPGISQLKDSELPEFFYDDEYFIAGMISRSDVMESFWPEYCIRVYWMKGRFFMLQGKMEDAVFFFKKTLSSLKETTEVSNKEIKIMLPACNVHNILSIEKVEEQLKSLERSQSFEETQRLYDAGEYKKVVECLLKTSLSQVSMTSPTERRSQLLLLQDSLIKLKDYKRALLWSEITLDEAVQGYKTSSSSDKEQLAETLVQTCETLNIILKKKEDYLSDLPVVNQARLSHHLIYMIDVEMSVPESCTDMPIGTVLPWILLYKLIERDETKDANESEGSEVDRTIPASLMLLNIAHEYLGRHAWCTKNDGEFLLFFIKVLTAENTSEWFNEELGQAIEQCFYCLYGYPSKKGRYRHLVDHNSPWIPFTWKRAADIFEYFKPKTLPEFDSYKTDAVAGEVEQMLRKICELVPESQKPIYVIDSLQGYIEGTIDVFDEESIYDPSPVSQELYYLLADYYFKNNDQAKAIKYYCNDICVNPKRLDSWAGMALARMSQLEQKLNSNELRMDFPIHKKSISALRCFRRALQIDDSNGKLWIEYGSLAYQLHSHASRQLKWKESSLLSPEIEQIAAKSRQEMLKTAHNCYNKAVECENEEEWIQHYMIGKCLEKMKKPYAEYIKHYEEAAGALYEENAPYPKKIAYAYTTPHLAVEALEMFYRLHASILKILLSKTLPDSDYQLFECFVNKAAKSPFACAKQKNEEMFESKDVNNLDEKENGADKGQSSTSQDHTYSKQKQEKILSLLQKPPDSGSSFLQKPTESLFVDSSSQSCGDSLSQESSMMSCDSVSQSKDKLYDESADSLSQPMEIENKSSGKHLEVKSNTATCDKDQSKLKTLELSANEMREEVTSDHTNSSLTIKLDVTKNRQLEILKKLDTRCDSPGSLGSSDIYEDEEGNITVTAKIESIDLSSSSEGETTANEEKGESCIATIETKSSFGFEPPHTDNIELSQPTEGTSSEEDVICLDESSQDIKISVKDTIENLVSTVETVDNLVVKVADDAHQKEISEEENTKDVLSSTNKQSEPNQPALSQNGSLVTNEKDSSDEKSADIVVLVSGSDNEKDETVKVKSTVMEDTTSKSRLPSLCPAYDSTSSEDEEITNNQTTQEKTENTEGHVFGNVSLCADYDSLSSNSNGPVDEHDKKSKDLNDVKADISFNENVSVLEISEGGISGDIRMQDEKPKELDQAGLKLEKQDIKSNEQNLKIENSIKDQQTDDSMELEQTIKKEELLEKTTEKVMEVEQIVKNENKNQFKDEKMDTDKTVISEKVTDSQTGSGPKESSADVEEKMEVESDTPLSNATKLGQNVKVDDEIQSINDKNKDSDKKSPEKNMDTSENIKESDDKATETKDGDENLVEQNMDLSKREDDINSDMEKNEKSASSSGKENEIELSGKTGEQLHKLLIEKCMAALHLCLSRFPTHYKSIYRLANVFVSSPYHKNLKFAQDLLLGVPNWQQQSHMPAQGLFGERKQMNFFQGIWRIPIGDIDRSGSFASHMKRSVSLLLHVLKERKELSLTYQIHLWMNRTPESGKKYLRDSERMLFVKISFKNCWEIIDKRNKDLEKMEDREKALKILLEVYKIWNYGNSSKMRSNLDLDTNQIFADTFKAVKKEAIEPDRPFVKQATDFCQHYHSVQKSQKTNSDSQSSGNKSDVSIFSPSRSPFPSFSPMRQTPGQSPSVSQSMQKTPQTTTPDQRPISQSLFSPSVASDKMKNISSPLASSNVTTKIADSKIIPRTDKVVQKTPSMPQKDLKNIPKKTVYKSVDDKPVVETLVGEINSTSIFETLLANEFGNKSSSGKALNKTSDEIDGTSKNKLPASANSRPAKQTIMVKPSTQPIICKVGNTQGGLNIVSPEFGSLEVLSPNTPCPDSMKFSIPSKDPKTKTTIVITKKKPPLNITEPIEISSSDDDDSNEAQVNRNDVTVAMATEVSKTPSSSADSNRTTNQEVKKPSHTVKRSIIQLDDVLDSADDSIPSSSASGSVYVPDESSDSIPSSPEAGTGKLRLDEVTGLFIPPDVKFFNDNHVIDDDM